MRLVAANLAPLLLWAGVLHAATPISGIVTDAATDRPLAGASVNVDIGSEKTRSVGPTDAHGQFKFNADDWSRQDRSKGVAWLDVSSDGYAPVYREVTYTLGTGAANVEIRLTASDGRGGLSTALRDSLAHERDGTGQSIAFAAFDLDAAGVDINAETLEARLMRRIRGSMVHYLLGQNLPEDLCEVNVKRLPSEIDLLDFGMARQAGEILNALAVVGCELRVRPADAGPTLAVTTTFLSLPRADSLSLPAQQIEDVLALDPGQPNSILGNAGDAWAHYAAIVIALREARDAATSGKEEHLLRARGLLAGVQRTLPATDGALHLWVARAIDTLDRWIRR